MKKKILMMTAGAFVGSALLVGSVFAESIKVKKGHTLYNISKTYDISLDEIKKLNNLKSNNIYIGQSLEVSKGEISSPVATIPAKETSKENTAITATYTVKKGDTLYRISKKNGISVADIKRYNNLKTNTIHIGQKLKLGKGTMNDPVKENIKHPVQEKLQTPDNETTQTVSYFVKKGDTLFGIGRQFGVPYQTIKQWNGLTNNSIYIGQKLSVSNSSVSTPIEDGVLSTDRNQLIAYAKSFMGTPYAWGGSSPSGFDCSGYIYYILKSQNLVSTRATVAGYWTQANKITNPQAGDLVFFENTYTPGPSHMGIYLGNDTFIHASSNGVSVHNVNSTYWANHFLGYGTFY